MGELKLIGSIPDLGYGSEDQRLTLRTNSNIGQFLDTLEEGLKYLEAIRESRGEYQRK